jgi:cysteinyl-tRNA synthetase
MAVALTSTLGGRKEEFRPLERGKARIYSCGPTVKEPLNLGKFRSFLLADVLRRELEYEGYEVRHVMNITDVGHLNEFEEDFVEIAAARTGLHAWELVEKEEKVFHEDRRGLHILDAHEYPHARQHIADMIALVEDLEKKGLTYRAGGNVYLDVGKCRGFGELSGKSPEELAQASSGSRAPAHLEKRQPLDIDLWRTDILHAVHWKSPWGRGFPGWHVECVAMSRRYLGDSFDVHTGTSENIFPHHECEIAQAEALSGKPLARYWLHSAPVTVDGKAMSTRDRNVVTVRELLAAGIRGAVVRVALLSKPYREVLDFSEALLDQAREEVNAFLAFHQHLQGAAAASAERSAEPALWITETDAEFRAALEDDLDVSGGLKAIVRRIQELDPESIGDPREALKAIEDWDRVLGIL